MIKTEDIYNATNGGLDIILGYYPQARDCIGTRKPFRMRDERTPSAYIKRFGEVWKVTDFGEDGHAMNAIDITMKEEGRNFKEALSLLAERYHISGAYITEANRPTITKRPAEGEEKEGDFIFDAKERMTEDELDILGPNVKQDHVEKLNYFSLTSYSITKRNDEGKLITTTVQSTERYPIFMRDCGEFKKIYQPLNANKAFRFFYVGQKLRDFVNGLAELRKQYTETNERERAIWEQDPSHEGKPYKEKKLDAAVICSGERDAINCQSFGYCPIWLNSETADLTEQAYKEITKYAEIVYNIPDIDETGIRRGRELAFRYINIRTALLPEWLRDHKDMRGNPKKDLRDFVSLRSKRQDFENLLKLAMPIRFWESTTSKEGVTRLDINTSYFLNFLYSSGYCRNVDRVTEDETLVRVTDAVVSKCNPKDIRAYSINWLRERHEEISVQNLLLNSRKTTSVALEDLPKREIEFTNAGTAHQYIHFANKTIKVTADEVTETKTALSGCNVWEDCVSPVRFRRTEPSFSMESVDGMYSVELKNTASKYMRCLINTSRVHWRKELEERESESKEENEAYNNENKFTLSGNRLTEEEVAEQMQNFASKCYAIGYLLHSKKEMQKAWALWVMEDTVSEDGVSSGGTGKSFMVKFLDVVKKILFIGGKDKNLTENQFIFQNVTSKTEVVWIDDADRHFDFAYFYDKITGSIEINRKHQDSKAVKYSDAPKFVFTSNFPPPNVDSATVRRLLFVIFSDYYHCKTADNDYRETRTIFDDFGCELGGENYSNDDYNLDVNFLVDCLQFYLRESADGKKLEPPMERVRDRISIAIMGNQFKQWAEVYFSEKGGNVNRLVAKSEVFVDFVSETNVKHWTTNKFSKAMKEFCEQCEWVETYKPAEMINDPKGRIIQKINGKTQEMFFVKTKKKAETEGNDTTLPF